MFSRHLLCILLSVLAAGVHAEEATSVLVLEQEDAARPAYISFMSGLRPQLAQRIPGQLNIYSENLDLARFDSPDYRQHLETWMQQKYAGRKLSAVVVGGNRSLDLILKIRNNLWPQVPIVFTAIPSAAVKQFSNSEHVAGVTMDVDVKKTLGAAVQLCPKAQRIVFISDGKTYPEVHKITLQQSREFASSRKMEVDPWVGLSMSDVKQRLAAIPADTIVFYLQINVDATGQFFIPRDALAQLSAVSKVPVFVSFETYIGFGGVGGACVNFQELGREVANQAADLIAGQPASMRPSGSLKFVFDWKQLKRFGLDARLLPPDSELRNKQPTLWEAYRHLVIAAVVVLIFQSLLILALLVQLRRRRIAERFLMESEARQSIAADAASLGFWSIEKRGLNLWTPEATRQLFGLDPKEPLEWPKFVELVHPEDRAAVLEALERGLSSAQQARVEYRVIRPDGALRWFSTIGRAQLTAKGEVAGTTGVSIDITKSVTERKEMEEHVQRQFLELAHFARVATLGDMTASITHELSQPLAAVLRNIETAEILLRANVPDLEELRAIVRDISKDNRRAGDVIDRLRALLKRRPLQPVKMQVPELINESIRLVQTDAASRSVSVVASTMPEVPMALGDRVHLQQVLLNLLINAIDAVEDRPERSVVVSARTREGMIEIAVSDTGPGIPPENMDLIFDSFFSSKPNGLGMGLSISRRIIEAHCGTITAENQPQGGAVFRFTLPCANDSTLP